MGMENKVLHGDCLELMKDIPDGSIDMILCDLPYQTTKCAWDVIIPFRPLWEQYKRIIKRNGATVLFGQEPFSSLLRTSNIVDYKYDWIWNKKIPSGMCNAKIQPMRQTESISVFIKGKSFYYPEMEVREKQIKSGGMKESLSGGTSGLSKLPIKTYDKKYPTTLLTFDKIRKGSFHPTQKPVALCEYLINTYTNEGETVLDNCAGSGTTGVACQNTNRNYILIEKEQRYIDVIEARLEQNYRRINENKLF